ncbi:MAG: hypothetical protein H6605_09680 [Flavobacteriales bacterium]|nr:hypothetical protein [Flavobacteriales bacterium]
MKTLSRILFVMLATPIVLTSCVSKKKYQELLDLKAGKEKKIEKLATELEDIKKEKMQLLDSLTLLKYESKN